MEISETRVESQHYVGVRRRVPADGVGAACAEILPRVARWLAAKGIAPASPPITVYHSMDQATGTFDLQPGFFVGSPVEDEDDITGGATAAGDAAATVHEGAYDTLGDTWGRVFAWVGEQGRTVSQSSWEVYLTDPGAMTDPSDNRTEIVVPMD